MAKTKLENKNPPRRVEIRGQDHLLAYITPDEAQLLMDNGGSGEPGPMGIPSFPPSERDSMGKNTGSGREGGPSGGGGNDKGRDDEKSTAKTARDLGISPGQSQAQFGTIDYAGRTPDAAIREAGERGNQFASGVAATRAKDIQDLVNLNRQLEDLSRREQIQKDRINSPMSLIPGVGLMNYLGLQNVRNLAAASIGAPPGLLGGLGFGDRVSPDFGGLGVSDLVGLQSQAITDDMGNIVGFRDEGGTLRYGTDPNEPMFDDGKGADTVPPVTNPVTGEQQCPDGYVFDADLQACRLDTALQNVGGTVGGTGFDYEPGTYARMGLLDVAPEDLGGFASTYGTGFGTQPDFESANLDYRRRAGTQAGIFQDPYNLEGMTLLA